MSVDQMKQQRELGSKWLTAGEIEWTIFLGSNVMDKNLKTVALTRAWITRVGDERLN